MFLLNIALLVLLAPLHKVPLMIPVPRCLYSEYILYYIATLENRYKLFLFLRPSNITVVDISHETRSQWTLC